MAYEMNSGPGLGDTFGIDQPKKKKGGGGCVYKVVKLIVGLFSSQRQLYIFFQNRITAAQIRQDG